jgi:hypothetical protein
MRHFTDALFEGIYDPPYSADEVRANYGEETYNKLVKDPAHKWRMDTGIELIHQEPSKKELDRIWTNWQLMDTESKKKSDEKSIELFGITNAENYTRLCPLYESKSVGELQISSPEELMDWMNDNITYELVDDEYSNSNGVPTKTAEEVLETKTGHCAEQSYLEKEILDSLGFETFLVMVKENNSKKEYGAEGSAHVFLVYKDEDGKFCWFEHSMQHARGIHKYNNLEALLQDVANQWWRYDKNSDILEVRMMDKCITGVDTWGLAKECYKLPVEYTFDISNNIMESDVPLDEEYSTIALNQQEVFFKDSILRRADGSLIPFYHGTKHNFTRFDPGKAGKGGPLGVGIYFTSKPATSAKFGNTKTVYLNVKNPKLFKTKSQPRDFLVAMSNEYKIDPQEVIKEQKSLNQKITELLQADGHDGVLCYFSDLGEMWCVVYNANQIKSVDNMNPTNSDDIFEELKI